MKQLIISVFAIMFLSWGCTKDNTVSEKGNIAAKSNNCESVRITQQNLGCDLWGIETGGRVYPVFNLPDSYKRESTTACVVYELRQDMRDCVAPCCGGIWAYIVSIQ